MTISYREAVELHCPQCSADLAAEVWLILDATEEPEAVTTLKAGQLNLVTCAACGHSGPVGAPLLFHDALARRVIFASAPGSTDHETRDQARELHALLVGSLPEEARQAYLADVDLVGDLDGIARLIARYERHLSRAAAAPNAPQRTPVPVAAPSEQRSAPAEEALLAAVNALLSADNTRELEAAIAAHPILLDPLSDAALDQLARVAADQGEREIAESLSQARYLLARTAEALAGVPAAPSPADPVVPTTIPELVLAELLAADSQAALEAMALKHPLLLHAVAQELLAARSDEALDLGDERLATTIEARREALIALQTNPPVDGAALEAAIESFLLADDQAAISAAIAEHPLLLSEAARSALWRFAAEARAADDEEMAAHAIERRELLKRILDAQK